MSTDYTIDCVIVADLSFDATYGETLFEISARADRRSDRALWRWHGPSNVGRSKMALASLQLGAPFCSNFLNANYAPFWCSFADGPAECRAYEQLGTGGRAARAEWSIDARRGNMTISASPSRCWHGRPAASKSWQPG